jgi:hypothetical protein
MTSGSAAQFFVNECVQKRGNVRSTLDCGGSTPLFLPLTRQRSVVRRNESRRAKAASSRRSPRCLRHSRFRIVKEEG